MFHSMSNKCQSIWSPWEIDAKPRTISSMLITHWGRVTHICVSYLGHHWSRLWLGAGQAPAHYLNQCWNIIDWTLWNKPQWNLNRNLCILKKMQLKMSSGKWLQFCLGNTQFPGNNQTCMSWCRVDGCWYGIGSRTVDMECPGVRDTKSIRPFCYSPDSPPLSISFIYWIPCRYLAGVAEVELR